MTDMISVILCIILCSVCILHSLEQRAQCIVVGPHNDDYPIVSFVRISLSVTKCCKFTHIKNVNKTCTFLNFDPVGGRHGGIISQKTPTQPLKWSVGT